MRKNLGIVAALGISTLLAGSALASGIHSRGAAAPQQQTIFSIDSPVNGATVFGIVEVRGFILDPRGVSRITLLVDGSAVHDADINQPRDDVQLRYVNFFGEGFPFPYNPGFVTSFLASNYTNGTHTLALNVTFSNSDVAVLGSRTVTVDNTITQAPIGALDSPRDPAIYGSSDYVSGVYPITGWAIDAAGIRQRLSPTGCSYPSDPNCHILADIEVLIDGLVGYSEVVYPLPRPDVANEHPDIANAFSSGFQMNLDTTRLTDGQHTIAVRAWNVAGMNAILGSVTIWVANSYATLRPFGHIDWPMSDAHFFSSSCFNGIPPSGVEFSPGHFIQWVSGWVIDQNDQLQFRGVKYVELLLDGSPIGDSRDCFFLPQFNMNVDCYGLDRGDILYQYPQFPADAKNSGFFFAVDVDFLLAEGIHQGLHYLSVRVGTLDPTRPAVIIDQIPILIECNLNNIFTSFGELEQPINMQLMQGTQLIKGWVYDFDGVARLNFYVDGVLDGSLIAPNSNLNMQRFDLRKRYPWLGTLLDFTGFQYNLDTTKYVDGVHQLVIQTVDYGGFTNYWVQRPIEFDNLNRP